MSYRKLAFLLVMAVLAPLALVSGVSAATVPVPLTALAPGETLSLGQVITSPNGNYVLKFHSDGNLVLHNGATLLWSSNTAGEGADRVVMEHDGRLAIYRPPAYGSEPIWSSRGGDYQGASLSLIDRGGLVIRATGNPILWSAALQAPDVGLAGVKHVVYGRGDQMVWLVEADGAVFDSYPVSGMATRPAPGRYKVFSKSLRAWSRDATITMEHMVRFVKPIPTRLAIGFHSIPIQYGRPVQTIDELGQYRSAGCVRQQDGKAEQLYGWAPVGMPVVVLA